MQILNFIAQTLLGELIVVIVGIFFAYGIKRQYDNWRYGRYHVRIIQHGTEVVHRPISPGKAEEILNEPADLAVFLKGVASPYGWITCDLISEGPRLGLLTIDRDKREFCLNLDHNPKKEELAAQTTPLTPYLAHEGMPQPHTIGSPDRAPSPTLLNFSHPLTPAQLTQITTLTGQPTPHLHHIPLQMDNNQPFAPQIQALLDTIPLTPSQWQTTPLLINPPAYAPALATLLAQLNGRIGYFPATLRLRPIPNSTPPQYEIAEILNLQTIRDTARHTRHPNPQSTPAH